VKTDFLLPENTSGQQQSTVYQFGTGVFLLGFVDWILEQLNQKSDLNIDVIALKARPGDSALIDKINAHEGNYDVHLRGLLDGEVIDRRDPISCLTGAVNPFACTEQTVALAVNPSWQWLISNTTEAGIQYTWQELSSVEVPQNFPALLAYMLWQRFEHCGQQSAPGVQIMCCELIEDNAVRLKAIIKQHAEDWSLPTAFSDWLDKQCGFYSTLVDRIVTGGDGLWQGEVGSTSIVAEPFYEWVIEAPASVAQQLRIPSGFSVTITNDLSSFRNRKVRVLNGVHTGTFAIALLSGITLVSEAEAHPVVGRYMRDLARTEIAPTLRQQHADIDDYIDSILERFANTAIAHRWQNIAMNAVSKWCARLMPTLMDAIHLQSEVRLIALSLAGLLVYYRRECLAQGHSLNDDADVVNTMSHVWQNGESLPLQVVELLQTTVLWGVDLSQFEAFSAQVVEWAVLLDHEGVESALSSFYAQD